ncbi:MAG: AAA family ATPase [Dechloromonas sp.]|nr:AAA family ATPase [Dechloromonas sp.]
MDEIHKKREWKNWLKGVVDGRPAGQMLLVTGGALMDTWHQSGDSLAGRYLAARLHPISVREWCEQQGANPAEALDHLVARGVFPEPCLAERPEDADRWRHQVFTDLIREDVVECARLHESTPCACSSHCCGSGWGRPRRWPPSPGIWTYRPPPSSATSTSCDR